MYKIEETGYGYKLTFSGKIKANEMAQWVKDSDEILTKQSGRFSLFMDMRSMEPLSPTAEQYLKTGQELFRKKGMDRSIAILGNQRDTAKLKRVALDTGTYDWERHVDASCEMTWEQTGIDWVTEGVDPDLVEIS